MTFTAFLEILWEIISIVFKLLWNIILFIYRQITGEQPEPELNDTYQAGFNHVKDVLHKDNNGFCLNGKYSISTSTSLMGGIGIGGSGYGKTSVLLLPSAYRMVGHSLCFHDPSGEIAKYTQGFYEMNGYKKILFLHYDKPEISIGYNPLKRIRTITDMQKVANLLVRNSLGNGSGNDNFWNLQATAFLTLLIAIVLKKDEQYRNLTNVKFLLDNYSSGKLDALVAEVSDSFILQEYKNFLGYDQKVISSIVATCRSALNLWNSPQVQLITSYDTIDFKSFREEPTVLYIQNKTLDLPFYSVLTSIFFEQFFNELMQELPASDSTCTFFMIDEFSSLFIPSINLAVSNLRKFRANCFFLVQSEFQVRHVYGEDQSTAILQNCYNKVYFPGQDAQTCERISRMLGKREFEVEDEQTGKKHKKVRELLTADEVRVLGEKRALIFVGTKAIYTHLYPFYEQKMFKAYSELPASPIASTVPFTTVPLIKL